VHVDAYGLGERAMQQLFRGDGLPQGRKWHHEVLPTTVVIRRSCGSTAAEDARSGAAPRSR
jgi:DNA-binding LacI/PurR family transcriptional regulator